MHPFQSILRGETVEWPPAAPGPRIIGLEDKSDDELLEWMQNNPEWAEDIFNIFYNRGRLDVWNYVRSRTASEDAAKDAFCLTWMAIANGLPKFVRKGFPIQHWVIKIAKNKTVELARDSNKQTTRAKALQYLLEVLELDKAPSAEDLAPIVRDEANKLVRQALTHLKSLRRYKIITLRYFGKKQVKEIAALLDMKPNTVTQELRRGLEELRHILSKIQGDVR